MTMETVNTLDTESALLLKWKSLLSKHLSKYIFIRNSISQYESQRFKQSHLFMILFRREDIFKNVKICIAPTKLKLILCSQRQVM